MHDKFRKPYDSKATEGAVYEQWEKSGYFNPDRLPGTRTEPYTIVLPPPNVTGVLHMGSALMIVIEDILIRFQRMRGKKALWIPGTDSAAIATQAKVEGDIYKKEKKTRYDIGREELLQRIDAFTKESEGTIIGQVKKMGASLDFSRYAYTLDDKRYKAVMEAFVRMYEAGLIYRGDRIVNWDPKLQTTVSDEEIEYVEQTDPFYYFKYGPFVIATVRPETKFGDKYVVMHPDDARYKEYTHGQTLNLEWINGPIVATVIKDESIDMEVGSGVMTITPAHSQIDFDIAQRHGLDIEPVIDGRGILLPIAGEFVGQHIKKARPLIVEKLQKKGLIVKIDENYVHNVATNSRGGGLIEPQIKKQWWLSVDKEFTLEKSDIEGLPAGSKTTLKKALIHVVETKQTTILPERYEKVYLHWVNNLRDWNISRQIWFGHRIPAWFKRELGGPHQATHFNVETLLDKLNLTEDEFRVKAGNEWQPLPQLPDYMRSAGSPNIQIGSTLLTILTNKNLIDQRWIEKNAIPQPMYKEEKIYVGLTPPQETGWVQDEDVLDTWFSSGLWTFSTLGWPEETSDLTIYHPTSVLETGYDILFFWVIRMIEMSVFHLGQIPFRHVYLHGLVRDGQGRKISKSLGNNIDPLDMADKYGMDAVRVSLIAGMAPGTDSKISEEKIRGYKHFTNKIWNISRFILESFETAGGKENAELTEDDARLLEEAHTIAKDVTVHIEGFRIDLAADTLYHYLWDRLAAEIIEESKPALKEGGDKAHSRAAALLAILKTCLKLLHPFMPFVTEEIWTEVPGKKSLLMVESWPQA